MRRVIPLLQAVLALLIAAPLFSKAARPAGEPLSLNIDRAVGIAIENSFELKEIMAREEIYSMTIDENFRQYFPSVTFSYFQTDEVRIRETDSRQSKLSVDTELLIYDGGKRTLNYEVAKLNALLASNDYKIALNKLIMQVRSAYLNLLKLKETVKIYQMTLDMGNIQLKFIRKEYELGDATKLAVMEIEAKIREIELSLKQAVDEYESSLKEFKLLLRIDWRTPVEITGDVEKDFIFISPVKIDDDEMISLAIRRRKEIESGRVQCEINRKIWRFRKTTTCPMFHLGLTIHLQVKNSLPVKKDGVSI